MSKLPTSKGDIGGFLLAYGPAYIAVDALAATIGLPPPIITATLTSGAVVGAKNVIQALLARSPSPQSKETLAERTKAFEELLNEDAQAESKHSAAAKETLERLSRAKRVWEKNIHSDPDRLYQGTLDELIAAYESATGTPGLSGKKIS